MRTGPIDHDLMTRPVEGLGLPGATLADALGGERPTLVAFLRHFG